METDDTELLNLAWKDYQQSTIKTFRNLLGDEHFADVTLACGKGQQLKAHKVILSSCSPFFKNILIQNPHQHPILYLTNVDMEDLESLMKFIYQGEVQIENEGLTKFLETANDLEIDGLFQKQAKIEKEKSMQKKELEAEKERASLLVKEKENAAQKEKEKAALKEKEKSVQRKRMEEWELKTKKRKAPEVEMAVDEVEAIIAPAPKSTKVANDSPKAGEKPKKQFGSWLQFLESQAAEKKGKSPQKPSTTVAAYSSQVDFVDVDADINAVHEITAINDSEIEIDDALEVDFPEDFGPGGSTSPSGRHCCNFCPKTFSRRTDIDRHLKKYHPSITDLALPEENGVGIYQEPLPENFNLNATACDICAKVFTTKWSMQEHRDSVHEGIRFLCDHCDHVASSKRNLRGHLGKKHPDQPLPAQYTSIRAEDTGYQRTFQPNYDEIKMDGGNALDYDGAPPQICEYEDARPLDAELEQKLDSMAERVGGVWTCVQCGKTAGTKFHLKRHAETHLEGYIHACPRCDKSFTTRPALKQHYDSHHKDEREGAGYPCDMCDKSAISKGALRIHKYRHHTVPPPTSGTWA